jgi:hypothetical protein
MLSSATSARSAFGRRILGGGGEQQVHAKEHGNGHMRVGEEVGAGRGVVDRAEDEHRHHGRHGHRRDAEQILPRHREEKDREIHLGRAELVVATSKPRVVWLAFVMSRSADATASGNDER